jgi:hypothetical protein
VRTKIHIVRTKYIQWDQKYIEGDQNSGGFPIKYWGQHLNPIGMYTSVANPET